ncbi:MAG: caspase family protein [Treponema sp.]|uniref:caspase family protein n=1 Tax=Treponema sp. TaxID=166 RepID=UPI0025DF8D6D|nr:caspase family protein [Treponema sp.]MBQ8678226.1 caspase family protein [Treponema sp.]
MKKIALIIGNGKYENQSGELKNPANDANSIENVFERLGIDTIKKVNIGVADFKDSLDDFKNKLSSYEVAIFFFAGHGLQIDGENFLCASDTDFSSENRIKYSSVALNYLLDVLRKSNILTKIIILDACRNNPFDNSSRAIITRGLAPISAPVGTFIAFATSPGQIANDGTGNNGAFTYSLLQHIETKDLRIEELFKQTRNTLYTLTGGKQISWEHTSLMGDFYFSSSSLTGEFSTSYSEVALRDGLFDNTKNSEVVRIINLLKSYNWDRQNQGIHKINATDLSSASIDELFVLGRNIYQTGCSTSWTANDYFANLKTNILAFSKEIAFHILNGLAFEIYFDKNGKLREEFKTGRLNEVLSLLMDKEFKESAQFIYSKLSAYDYRVIFYPISETIKTIDVLCTEKEKGIFAISSINVTGKNVMYNYDGSDFYAINDAIILQSRDYIKKKICEKIAARESCILINFLGIDSDVEKICIPYEFKLLYYRIKEKN